MANNGSVKSIFTNYFKEIIEQIDSSVKIVSNQSNRERVTQTRDEFVKKVNEIESFNWDAYSRESNAINARIKKFKKLRLSPEDLELKKNREYFKLNCWFISSIHFKDQITKTKYPLGILAVNNIHPSDKVLSKFRENCEEYVYDGLSTDYFKKEEEKETKKSENRCEKLMSFMKEHGKDLGIHGSDDDDDDDYGYNPYNNGMDDMDDDYLEEYFGSDDSDDCNDPESGFKKATGLNQDFIAVYEIFVKITNQINNETQTESIIDATNISVTSLVLKEHLTNIDTDGLRNFINLKHLDLRNNVIDEIQRNAFQSLINLETLNLGDNDLEYIPDGLFKNMKSLKSLTLVTQHIKPKSFEGLSNLEELDLQLLSKNKMDLYRLSIFECLEKLKKLTFKWVDNEYYEDDYFESDDCNNEAQVSDKKFLSNNKNQCSFLKGLTKLEHLSLSGLKMDFFKLNCFKQTPNVKVLYLENNSLAVFNNMFFTGLKYVTELSLAFNEMKSIENGFFQELTGLETLKLNGNKIEAINENDFDGLTNLQVLDLTGNPIKSFAKNIFEKLKSMNEFNYDGNQLEALKKSDFNDVASVLQNVNEKVKKINRESLGASFKTVITNHFKDIRTGIDYVEERMMTQFRANSKSNETNKQLVAKSKVELFKKISEVEEFNLNEFDRNEELIVSRINELKKQNLDENTFKEKQSNELISLNCWFISKLSIKKQKNKEKYPLGLLVITDLKVSNEKLSSFKNKCEDYSEWDEDQEKYENKNGPLSHRDLIKLCTPYRYDPYASSSEESFDLVEEKVIFNQDFLARYQFFQEIVDTITRSEKKDSIFEMRCSSIEELIFPETDIALIDGEVFKCFSNLKRLSFPSNSIESIDKDWFKYLTHLEELDLSDNRLKVLPENVFSELKNLRVLNLSGNILKKIDLKGLSSLEGLRIEMNKKINPMEALLMFEKLNALKSLNFKWSEDDEDEDEDDNDDDDDEDEDDEDDEDDDEEKMDEDDYDAQESKSHVTKHKEVSKESKPTNQESNAQRPLSEFFKGLCNLKELSLTGLNNNLIESDCLKHFEKIEKLSLEKCSIKSVKQGIFAAAKHLKELSLASNDIISIDADSFKELTNLKKLKLNKNKINEIKNYHFSGLVNLEELDLSENYIKVIDEQSFKDLKALKELKLSNNQLTKTTKNNLKQLKTIHLVV